MPNLLKNYYDQHFINELSDTISNIHPTFPKKKFISLVIDGQWPEKELKQRMRHISSCLHQTLPADFNEAVAILKKTATVTPPSKMNSLLYMFMPDFIEQHGLSYWGTSIDALELFTQHSTSEFAVRPFIMADWSKHPNHHVRRLSSEGCRPRLPWAMSLPEFKKDPSPIIPILENLKNDTSEYVRRSVANNLNDISKDHPELVMDIAGRWIGESRNTDRLVKHALRSMLKAGDKKSLELFGFADSKDIKLSDLKLKESNLKIGDDLEFSFSVSVNSKKTPKIRLEYAICFAKPTGRPSKKIFKISERDNLKSGHIQVAKRHSLKDLSTRKHHPGKHSVSIIINGREQDRADFMLNY